MNIAYLVEQLWLDISLTHLPACQSNFFKTKAHIQWFEGAI